MAYIFLHYVWYFFFFFTILVLVETLSTFLMSFKPSMFLYFNGLFRIIKSASTSLRQLFYSPAIIIPFHNRMVQVVIFWKYITSCLFVIFSQIDVYPATFPNIYLMYLREDLVWLLHSKEKNWKNILWKPYANSESIWIVLLSWDLLLNHSVNEFYIFPTWYESYKWNCMLPTFIRELL